MGKNQWVVRHGDGWAQRGEGNSRVTRAFDRQREAIDSARETARRRQRAVHPEPGGPDPRAEQLRSRPPSPEGMTRSWSCLPDS